MKKLSLAVLVIGADHLRRERNEALAMLMVSASKLRLPKGIVARAANPEVGMTPPICQWRACVYGATSFSLGGAPSINQSLVDPSITI